MRVRFYIDLDVDIEKEDMSESTDMVIYGNKYVEKKLKEVDSCDDFPLYWMELKEEKENKSIQN